MPRQTPEAVAAEVQRLETMKPTVLRYSSFGDDHHAAIEAQVDVLRRGLSERGVYDAYGDEEREDFRESLLSAALDAQHWLAGDRDEAPAQEWQELVRQPAAALKA